MFCRYFSDNLCTTASLVDNKPHFFQPCQIVCTVSWECVSLRVEECEGSRHDQMLLLFWIADNVIHTIFTGSTPITRVISVLCFLYKKSYGMFFLSHNKPFGPVVCHTEEAIKTSATTITWVTKFIAMLRPLYFNTKIHCEYFFCWERYFADMLQSKFERTFLENGNLIC